MWSVSTATKEDTLQGSARHLGIKTTGTGSLPKGLCQLRKLLQMPQCLSVMALANSEVSNDSNCCSSCLECVKDLKEQNEQLVKDLRTAWISVVSYKTGLESVEAKLLVFKKNESVCEENIKLLKCEIYLRDLDIIELKRKLELATKEKDEVQLTVQNFENSSKILSKLLDSQIMDKCKIGLGYNAVLPPYTGNFMPPKPDLVYPSLDDFVEVNESVSESIVENPTIETNEPEIARKENRAPIIKDWVFDSDEKNMCLRSVNTIQPRTAVNNAGPIKNIINNAYSTARRPFNKITAANNSNFTKKFNTVKGTRVNTARPKAVISAVKGNKGNVVKALACWGNPQQDLKAKGVIDSGCFRYMTGNRSYLIDYEEIDGGFVAFGGNYKGGKIIGKGKIRTGKLDFEDVYFVKELKFNIFSVSQMCDKKNSVLFTDTECVVLSPDFKLTDENHVLLKVPRKDSMYSVDLKNVIPHGGLTCLYAKATLDESNLWHKRLGHVNFKTMNKLVRGNLVRGRKQALSFMRPFGCPVTILNTIDHLGKFDGKADEGFFVAYSANSKEIRVFNSRTRIVEENLHVQFSENITNIAGSGPNWLFDIDALIKSMHYKPVVAGNQSDGKTCTKAYADVGKARVDIVSRKDYILLPLWTQHPPFSSSPKNSPDTGFKSLGEEKKKDAEDPRNEGGNPSKEGERINQEKDASVNSTNNINTASDENSTHNINTISPTVNAASIEDNVVDENIVYGCADDPNIHELEDISYSNYDRPVEQIIGDLNSAPQTRRMIKNLKDHHLFSSVQQRTNHKDFQNCLFTCFLSQEEPKKLPNGKRVIGTKWVFRNKKDKRRIVIKNKAILVEQGYIQEEGIDYDEVFAPGARIEAIRLFLAYPLIKDFMVYQMDVKSAFLYGKIEEEVYVYQPPGFEDPDFPDRVYKVEKKFGFSDVKTASTPMETHKPLLKDVDGEDVDEHLYRSMIGSLMYLASSRPDIMFVVCACARFQVNPKISHLHAVKRIFRYLKGQPKLGLWYPKGSPFDLVAFTDNDYAGASLDRKSTIGGCQFLGCRLISWQCKKQTVIYNDNESRICIVKNPVFHSKTKHIEIRHHFIRDSNEKKPIQMIKIHTDQNVSNLLTKAFNWIIHKGWLKWNAKAAKDGIRVKTGNSSVNAVVITLYCWALLSTVGKKLNANFAKIVDFLNAKPIRDALIVSPTIYVSCIEQFWSTAKTKTVNNETHIHAKVESKTIVILKSSMRRDLQFDDEDGTITSLFSSMLAQQADMGKGSGQPTNPQHTSTSAQPSNEEPIIVPSLSQPKNTHRPRKAKRATEIS
ncbi:putative ribonuclease H-like domain-containing protein [Tanacetum coccineum]